jgi:uncharacterized protein YdaU (DUF1376 family)
MKIPYIALYPAPFIADTYHLGNMELGIYWRLLLYYYLHLQPLPYDIDSVCRIAYATSPEERKAVEFVLTKFFTADTDPKGQKVWRHHRADEEIERALERVEVNHARTRAATQARKIQRDDVRDVQRHVEHHVNDLERERDLDLDQELEEREREAKTPLSPKKLIDKKGEIPEEEIEWAIRERPDLTREHVTRVMARRFEIHYQGIPLTPQERAKKWMEWVIAENRNGGNGNGHKSYKQIAKEERKRLSDLDREKFLGKGKGTNRTNGEVTSHE